MTTSATLPSLLCNVLSGLEQVYIEKGAGRVGMPSLDQWANLLRVLGNTAIDQRELPALLRLSKRAVRSRISSAVRNGWCQDSKYGRGQVTVRLTVRGMEVASRWHSLQCAAEERWGGDRCRNNEEPPQIPSKGCRCVAVGASPLPGDVWGGGRKHHGWQRAGLESSASRERR